MSLTNDLDWGMKIWDDLEQKSVPKHCNTKQILLSFRKRQRIAIGYCSPVSAAGPSCSPL